MKPEELEAFLMKHDLSDDDFAALVGVTAPAVKHWLYGRRAIPPTVIKLIKYFDKYPDVMDEF